MTKQDVEIAIKTASNALDNNFVLAAAQGALLLAGGLYLAYEMYKKGGEEKAADHLVQNKTAQKVPGGYLFKDKFYESPKSLWQAFVTTHTVLKAFIQYKMDAAPQDVTFKDQGFDVETNKPKINSTPIHDEKPQEEWYPKLPADDIMPQNEGFKPYDGPSGNILTRGELPKDIPSGTWTPPEEALDKIPDFLGEGKQINKGDGFKWIGKYGSNQVRIDRGNLTQDYPHQQVDHVRINVNGKMMGVDGKLLPAGTKANIPETHIPLSEWLKWKSWDSK